MILAKKVLFFSPFFAQKNLKENGGKNNIPGPEKQQRPVFIKPATGKRFSRFRQQLR
jgi:hypothetical protein